MELAGPASGRQGRLRAHRISAPAVLTGCVRFNKLKHFRRFATRYDRLAAHDLAFSPLAASMIWMR